jgi:filamentous hemagglutinin family protein
MATLLPDFPAFRRRFGFTVVAMVVVLFPSAGWCTPGVVLDGSFGAAGALPGPNYIITSGMGRQVGSNLFQSFSSFNLTSAESATFTGPAQIQNIVARVTGGSASSIDGTINSSIAGANLFLLNPSGVMFGAHAQVNVSGAFAVGTPDYVKLADGGKFNTSLGGADNLTSAPVSAFGFLSPHPAPVTMNGTYLAVNPGQGLHVIAGDVSLNNTELDASSGNLTIFSAASAGEVPFSLATAGSGFAQATNKSFGNISITNNSYVDIDGFGGGNLVMRGGRLTVDDSTISAYNGGTIAGGKISLQANQIAIQDSAEILTYAGSSGNAGNVLLQGGGVTIDGTDQPSGSGPGILSFALDGATGGAGSVAVAVTGAVNILSGGQIAVATGSTGGNISVQAGSLDIDGSATPEQVTGLTTLSSAAAPGVSGAISVSVAHNASLIGGGAIFSDAEAEGSAGAVRVFAGGALNLSGGGTIYSSTSGSGAAGNVNVHAGSMSLTDDALILSYSEPIGAANLGDAGSVNVTVSQGLLISGGSLIASQTSSFGRAGAVTVQAGSATINGQGLDVFTGISDQTGTGALGNAGSVTVNVNQGLTLENEGGITSYTFSSGNAGAVNVNVLGGLTMTAGGRISSNTYAAGNGGPVLVQASSLYINGAGVYGATGITAIADTGSTGSGAALTVNVGGAAIITGGGQISTTTFSSGNGGLLTVNAGGAITLTNGGAIQAGTFSSGFSGAVFVQSASLYIGDAATASFITGVSNESGVGATGNSGSVTLNIAGSLIVADGGEISSGTKSIGNGGNVTVNAGSLTIGDAAGAAHLTGITSETDGTLNFQGYPTGQGGNAGSVNVTVRGALVITSGKIDTDTFCSGNAGGVFVHAGSLSIDGSATPAALTGIYSDSNGYLGDTTGEGGNAGTVSVVVNGALSLTGRGKIGAATITSGRGGDIDVQAGSLGIDGSLTGITAQALGRGNSGNITIRAGNMALMNHGTITVSSSFSNAGSIVIDASNLTLEGFGAISTEAKLNGGNITLNVGNVLYLLHSEINAAAGHNGGNILIDPTFVVLNDSLISANAAAGEGGNITIDSDYFFNFNSLITATGTTTNGTITITAPDLDLASNLLVLRSDLVQAEKELRERCARSLNHEFSSIIVVGRGGVETPPDELQPDFGIDYLAEPANTAP